MIVVRSLRVTFVALATALAVCGPAAPADIDVVAETTLGSVPPQTHEEAVGASKSAMMGSPTTALANAEAAEKLAADILDDDERHKAEATALWLQAEATSRLGRPQEASEILTRAEAAIDDPKSRLAADIALSRGRIQRALGEDGKALESFQTAHGLFGRLGEARYQAIALQSIGTLYDNARQYARAIKYYEQAEKAHPEDPVIALVSLNNRANAYRAIEEFDLARQMLDEALARAEEIESDLLQLRILDNMAILEVRRGRLAEADVAYREAVERA